MRSLCENTSQSAIGAKTKRRASNNQKLLYNSYKVKNLNIKPMSTYSEVLSQAQSLTPQEQQQLLEVLSTKYCQHCCAIEQQPKLRVAVKDCPGKI
jgi:hypothetical protein